MTLLGLLKFEMGQRNLTRFFTTTPAEDSDAVLTAYLDAGREGYAKKRAYPRSEGVDIVNALSVVLPSAMLWPKKLWLDGRELTEKVQYQHDKTLDVSLAFTPFESMVGPIPDSNDADTYGDWSYDVLRRAIAFDVAKSGKLTIGGLGIPPAGALTAGESDVVITFALSKVYDSIIMKLIAKPDLEIPGFSIKQHLPQMQEEAERLKKEFNASISPYGVVMRS